MGSQRVGHNWVAFTGWFPMNNSGTLVTKNWTVTISSFHRLHSPWSNQKNTATIRRQIVYPFSMTLEGSNTVLGEQLYPSWDAQRGSLLTCFTIPGEHPSNSVQLCRLHCKQDALFIQFLPKWLTEKKNSFELKIQDGPKGCSDHFGSQVSTMCD